MKCTECSSDTRLCQCVEAERDRLEAKRNILETPPHYTHSSIECIDAIRAALTPEEFRGFCKGNVLKYIWRERHKAGDVDVAKAGDYVNFLLELKQDEDSF